MWLIRKTYLNLFCVLESNCNAARSTVQAKNRNATALLFMKRIELVVVDWIKEQNLMAEWVHTRSFSNGRVLIFLIYVSFLQAVWPALHPEWEISKLWFEIFHASSGNARLATCVYNTVRGVSTQRHLRVSAVFVNPAVRPYNVGNKIQSFSKNRLKNTENVTRGECEDIEIFDWLKLKSEEFIIYCMLVNTTSIRRFHLDT